MRAGYQMLVLLGDKNGDAVKWRPEKLGVCYELVNVIGRRKGENHLGVGNEVHIGSWSTQPLKNIETFL